MKIHEVEKMLSVSRVYIRCWEKEGLLVPPSEEESFEYTDEDILCLKKILVLFKLGFTIEEISDMQKGELFLPEAAQKGIESLTIEKEELSAPLEVLREIMEARLSFDDMDGAYYWNLIQAKEQHGEQFVENNFTLAQWTLYLLQAGLKQTFLFVSQKSRKKYGVPIEIGTLLLLCVLRGLGQKLIWQGSFWEGFLSPFFIFLGICVIMIPLFLLSKKSPKAAAVISGGLMVLCLLFLAAILLLLVVLILNAIFHFW